jgi:hypothetical protein
MGLYPSFVFPELWDFIHLLSFQSDGTLFIFVFPELWDFIHLLSFQSYGTLFIFCLSRVMGLYPSFVFPEL